MLTCCLEYIAVQMVSRIRQFGSVLMKSDLGRDFRARIKKQGEQPETRREPKSAQELLLGEPRRVVAGAFHYFDSLQHALTDRLDLDGLALAN